MSKTTKGLVKAFLITVVLTLAIQIFPFKINIVSLLAYNIILVHLLIIFNLLNVFSDLF